MGNPFPGEGEDEQVLKEINLLTSPLLFTPGIDIATHVNIAASFPGFDPPRVSCVIFPIPGR